MQIKVQGKQISVGGALRGHVEERIGETNTKYFNHATDAVVTFSRVGHGHGLIRTHISIHVSKSIQVMADAEEGDAYLSFDVALAKAAKQMRRYKKRLRDHKERMERVPVTQARDYTLSAGDMAAEEAPTGKDPVIIAEMTTRIETLSVSEAVMRLDLSGQTALLFRNPKHNQLNLVYRRPDGNVGWVDTGDAATLKASRAGSKVKGRVKPAPRLQSVKGKRRA